MVDIQRVRNKSDVAVVLTLIYEFMDWLSGRYPELHDTIADYFNSQGLEDELANLPSVFGPPGGECLLARIDDERVGILMFKKHSTDECEMNRMFVRASARRNGVGQALGHRLIECAREMGYKRMILSALDRHEEALPLYRKLGFVHEDRETDTSSAEREVCMALDLTVEQRKAT